jgi:F-box and leucine-rich repeat protein 1 (S-phase kinase-associated protein 2)
VELICNNLRFLETLSTSRCYSISPSTYLILKSSTLRYLNAFGSFRETALNELKLQLPNVEINKFFFSSIARPTFGNKRTSIWNMRVRDVNPH